jgi:hypothetical protein
MKISSPRSVHLLLRIALECDRTLRKRCSELMAEVRAGRRLPPSAVWVVDNYAFLHGQLRQVRDAIPPGYEKHLARLTGGLLWGHPRMYVAAFELISECDGAVTEEAIREFLKRYQRGHTLTLAELWALGPLLKLALVQKACVAVERGPLDSAVCEAAIKDAISSLRNIEITVWSEIVEDVSLVEATLRRDPAGAYASMDRQTRDSYRRAVEGFAKATGWSETEIAAEALELAQSAPVSNHIGYYLVDEGRDLLAARTGYRMKFREAIWKRLYQAPNLFYIGSIVTATLAVTVAAYLLISPAPWWLAALLALPASQAALSLTNLAANWLAPPRRLPRLDFSDGIPADCRTFVVIPTLLISRAEARSLLERLEIHYLANRDPNLLFGLLTDFPDSATPAGDSAVLEDCIAGIRSLNRRHGNDGRGPFYLFHRPLRWNESERVWMGYERKRGKLNDFNALLLGEGDAFTVKEGDLSAIRGVRYVLTLDSDTQLPRDAARGLVGAIAHPLNRPSVDPKTETVRKGYALLQPRVGISMESSTRSRLARIYSGQTGFDPYTTAVSDVYQDLHGQASFTGKGIYDVAIFHRVAGSRFPENTLLSHDLIEGEHARVGLVTDLEVIDDFPTTYESYCKRKHRWVRGDWQILQWIFPRTPGGMKNPLGLLSRWKIFDNLRRSLLELSLLVFLLAGWMAVPGGAFRITVTALALLVAPAYADALVSLLRFPPAKFWAAYVRELAFRLSRAHLDAFLNVVFLVHQGVLMADAVIRTLVRRFITHRRLLQWQTMAQAEAEARHGLNLMNAYLLASPVVALAAGLVLARSGADLLTAVFLESWVAAPVAAVWLNRKPRGSKARASDDGDYLRGVALRTWRYFTDFGGPEDHWIVPDNVQETPPATARRTSPTNLGLQLTATVAARDFGYVTHQELAMRLDQTLASMEALPRLRGHFYNWYDTESLGPIEPLYISTVDSGNLAAALVAVHQYCAGAAREPLMSSDSLSGLRDHFMRLRDSLPPAGRTSSVMRLMTALDRQLRYKPTDLFCWESLFGEVSSLITRLREPLERAAGFVEERDPAAADEVRYWFAALESHIEAGSADLFTLAPWLEEPFEAEIRALWNNPEMPGLIALLARVPSLGELAGRYRAIAREVLARLDSGNSLHPAARAAFSSLLARLDEAAVQAARLLSEYERCGSIASRWVEEMDFAFLFDRRRKLLRIGYHVEPGKLDVAYYDLLASEARSAVFIAIAKGDIPREAWFHLGRRLTSSQGESTLVSWSGTMFEYLMPSLFMRTYDGTLLAESLRSAVQVQQQYGRSRGVPWGISESAYATRDHAMIYQYRPFGIPELSSNPDLSFDLVIAPYASMLATMVDRASASANLRAMEANGWTGRYGFYESADYTERPGEDRPEVVRAYMAHHQAMGFLALCNTLLDGRMRERFHRDPLAQSTEYLLQERLPALLEVTDEQQKLSLEFRLPATIGANKRESSPRVTAAG